MPPSSPAPAPAAASAPAGGVPPAASPASRPQASVKDELYAALGEDPKEAQPPDNPPENPEVNPPDNPPANPPPKSEEPKAKGKAYALREAYEQSKAEVKRLTAELEQARTAKPEADPGKLSAAVEAANKRAEAAEERLRQVAYERSDDFQNRFIKPKSNAYQRAYGDLVGAEIETEDGGVKVLSEQEAVSVFNSIVRMKTADAIKAAKQYGEFKQTILQHRQRILELDEAQQAALEESRTKGAAMEKEQSAKAQAAAMQEAQAFHRFKTEAQGRYKDWFAPVEGDEVGNKLLQLDEKLADQVFGDMSAISPAERPKIFAAAYNRIRAFSRLTHFLEQRDARIKELETALAQYEDSGPHGGERRQPGKANGQQGNRSLVAEVGDEIDRISSGRS